MERIINLIKNKNWDEILNFSKALKEEERFSTISLLNLLQKKLPIITEEDGILKFFSGLSNKNSMSAIWYR